MISEMERAENCTFKYTFDQGKILAENSWMHLIKNAQSHVDDKQLFST